MKTRQLALGGLLTALSFDSSVFGPYLRIIIGPFTATLASHVPLFLAALVSPLVAGMVGGVCIRHAGGDPVVAAKAFTHLFCGFNSSFWCKGNPIVALGAALPVAPAEAS